MGQQPTKALNNVYCRARLEAAKYNPKLSSREGAAELLGISAYSLGDYELGNTIPPCDKVNLMADLYNAPELKNYYCTNECPIGEKTVKKIEVKEIDRTTIELLSTLKKIPNVSDILLTIAEDGIISPDEEESLLEILEVLEKVSIKTQELQLSFSKSKLQ